MKQFKEICEVPFTYNIVVSAFIISSLAFRISIELFPPGILVVGLIFTSLRTAILTYFCQILKDASSEVADAIYDCGWQNFEDEKIRKLVTYSLMRAQKSEGFKILDWAEINLELFAKVRNKFLNKIKN